MPQTNQMIAEYPEILLHVIAELRGAFLDGERNLRTMIDSLGSQITDPTSVLIAFQEITDSYPEAKPALDLLLAEGGELREAQFTREFGGIRQMGPSRLEREQPWNTPESIAELLFYYGMIGRGFKGAGQNAHTIVYIPSDIIPWLPRPATVDGEQGTGRSSDPAPPRPPACSTWKTPSSKTPARSWASSIPKDCGCKPMARPTPPTSTN